MKHRILSLTLALILALSGTALAASLDPSVPPPQDAYGKYDPPITITTIHSANDGAFWFPAGDDINNNIYTRTWEERLGIKYEFLWTVPQSQGEDRVNVMIASGDLPDFFSVNKKQFEMLQSAGLLEDLTEPIEQYASQYTKKYLSGDYAVLLDAATRDGRTYGLTNGFTFHDTCQMIWLRADWLEKLDLETPKTLAELEAIMEAFKTQDPDGNGVDDTYPIAMKAASLDSVTWGVPTPFLNMFHVYPSNSFTSASWAVSPDGGLEDTLFGPSYRENMRTAIETTKRYYEAGYIDPDFTTYDDTMFQQQIFNDKNGIVFMDLWGAYWPLVMHLDINPEADWVPVPIVSFDDQPAKTSNSMSTVQNILVARKGVEHPEALVKMSNLYHDLNNNPDTMEFEAFNTDPIDNNQIFLAYPLLVYNPSFNYEGYLAISNAMETGNTDELCSAYKLFHDQAIMFRDEGDVSGFPPYRSYTDAGCLGVQNHYIENKLMQMNEYDGDATQLMIENDPTIKKSFDTMFLGIVTGGDIAKYDEFLQLYDDIYVPTVVKEVNEWFEAKGKASLQEQFETAE